MFFPISMFLKQKATCISEYRTWCVTYTFAFSPHISENAMTPEVCPPPEGGNILASEFLTCLDFTKFHLIRRQRRNKKKEKERKRDREEANEQKSTGKSTTNVLSWKQLKQPIQWTYAVVPPQTKKEFLLSPTLALVAFYERRLHSLVIFFTGRHHTHTTTY